MTTTDLNSTAKYKKAPVKAPVITDSQIESYLRSTYLPPEQCTRFDVRKLWSHNYRLNYWGEKVIDRDDSNITLSKKVKAMMPDNKIILSRFIVVEVKDNQITSIMKLEEF